MRLLAGAAAMTTPAKCVRLESSCEALADDLAGWPAGQRLLHRAHLLGGQRLHGEQTVDEQAVTTRRRHPASRGVRAGDEAGFLQSAITLRMVAGDRSRPENFDNAREPTGCPSAM